MEAQQPFHFGHRVKSLGANSGHVARVALSQVRVGSVVVYDDDTVVGERGALSTSLLGMTFLSKLSRVEVASGALVLKQ